MITEDNMGYLSYLGVQGAAFKVHVLKESKPEGLELRIWVKVECCS